ncbi:Hypothetical protein GbCGDNIH2_8047 [Granulibacter bethesdensis]|uniref:Uncharacterized protein n=1 Tax=Granulibacter bethesdensis (strain ATCC BAA-1260 / CGDNIH1) TaxID=391165 RepID=A0A286M311_GRABC|nr:Hypothetical protein GbCGDNIH2_8047 [Granulibacter bethesdensis]APH51923.1 Hypothetical protein GbCGDNIH5_8047 [Granulibacter bethesdensis]APH64613.1 Hypothetical protein GbCGDNIH1I4_8047 [Granulibacter bethesdensis]ASV62410.1 Hypothetical protein GbCGDNIH1_8047 [Granulibacter bethesdensis CGDNIH1]
MKEEGEHDDDFARVPVSMALVFSASGPVVQTVIYCTKYDFYCYLCIYIIIKSMIILPNISNGVCPA